MIEGVILDIGGVVLPYAELEEPHDQKWERLLNLGPGSIAKRIWSHDNAKRAGTGQMQFPNSNAGSAKSLGSGASCCGSGMKANGRRWSSIL
jgi:hypothetical protein